MAHALKTVVSSSKKFGDEAYKMLPVRWRASDSQDSVRSVREGPGLAAESLKFHHRFLRALGGGYDDILEAVREVINYFDPMSSPSDILPYLSMNSGWPLDPNMPDSMKRLLIRSVYQMVYLGKGNLPRIASAARAFTGLQIKFETYTHGETMMRTGLSKLIVTINDVGSIATPPGTLSYILITGTDGDDLNPGDIVLLQYGSTKESAVIEEILPGRIVLATALNQFFPAGSRLIRIEGMGCQRRTNTLGIGRLRVSCSSRRNLMQMGRVSANNMIGSVQVASYRGQQGISDLGRARRFTFIAKVSASGELVDPKKDKLLRFLLNYMKPERCHFIVEYGEDMLQDNFRVGYSEFGSGPTLGGI